MKPILWLLKTQFGVGVASVLMSVCSIFTTLLLWSWFSDKQNITSNGKSQKLLLGWNCFWTKAKNDPV